jgi:hypothetical protein
VFIIAVRFVSVATDRIQKYLELTQVQWTHDGAVIEALRYKPDGRGIDSRWCHWNFSLTQSFRQHYGPGMDSDSNRNEFQKYFLGVKAAGA